MGDLLNLTCRVADAIASRVPPGQAVATLLPRTPEATAGLLGCMVSGRPCIILDPAEVPDRLALLIADAAPALLLHAGTAPRFPDLETLALETALANPRRTPLGASSEVWDPDAPFAVQFTSGSTGRPKAIVISARGVLFRALVNLEHFHLTATDRLAPIASMGQSGLLAPLAVGAALVLTDLKAEGAGAVLRRMEREAVTICSISPPIMRMLRALQAAPRAFSTMRILRSGGVAMTPADVAAWREILPAGCTIDSAYASTEAPMTAYWSIPASHQLTEPTIPAGHPQPGVDYALLEDDGSRAAPGAVGELVIRSPYLALGEWRAGRLVTDRFPTSPDRPGWREMRTGDVARIGDDGLLRVVGRVDRMIKINGVRVEPAEIEAVIHGEPGVIDVAVIAAASDGETILHAFVVAPDAGADIIPSLRRRFAAALPSSLRPARITLLDRLPTLPNGKTDRAALADASI